MNSRQLQYVLMLSEARSFSQVADELDISQPALSKQIIGLENELGVKLFDRSTTPITLTPAGECFVEKARELLFEEDVLLKTMERYKTGENGKLSIGVSPFRSLYLMPPLVKALKERFPGLQIVLNEYGRAQLHKGLAEGLFDFIVTNLPVDEASFEAIPLEKDTLVLAVPNRLLHLISPEYQHGETIRMHGCAALPFAVIKAGQEMRQMFDKLCRLDRINPNIFVEVTGVTTAWEMTKTGLAATLLPKQFIQSELSHTEVTTFELAQELCVRQPAIVARRGQFLSEYAQYAMKLLQRL